MVFSRKEKRMKQTFVRCSRILNFILLFALVDGEISGRMFAQGLEKTISIKMENVSVLKTLQTINKMSDNLLIFRTEDVAKETKKVTIDLQNAQVKVVVKKVLEGTSLTYIEKNGKIVVVRCQENPSLVRVKGKVVDEKGQPLPGVTVRYRAKNGALIGGISDHGGIFSVLLTGNKDTLTFTFIGMKPITRIVKPKESWLDIQMYPDVEEIDEIIVTGYEKFDKRKLTGSVVTLKGKDVIEPIGLSIDQMLQGKVPGMTIMQASSTPGATPKIRIRGSSSILGNREPIWVVDGIILSDPVKISNAELNSMDYVNLIGNAISFLNPQDIESINILKDASATAIYGSKAANGVVVITTKQGKTGRMSVNYSLNMSVKERPSYRTLNLMNSDERVQVSQEIAERGLNFPKGTDPLIGYEGLLNDLWNKKITYEEFNRQVDVLRGMNTDWFGELLRVPFSHTHNLSLSGGSDKLTYYVSGSYAIDKGIQLKTDVQRQTISSSINAKLTEKLSLSAKLNASFMQNNRTHSSIDLMSYAYKTSRAIPLYNEDGSLFFYAGKNADLGYNTMEEIYVDYNILHELEHTAENQNSHSVGVNFQLGYSITSELNVDAQFAYNKSAVKMESWADEQSFLVCAEKQVPYGYEIPDKMKASIVNPFGGKHSYALTENSSIDGKISVNYNKLINRHSFNVMVGSDIRSVVYQGYRKESLGYYPNRGKSFSINVPLEYTEYHKTVANMVPVITDNVANTVSFYGVLRYSFDNRYVLNFNIRTDGSNQFGQAKENRFLPVWSISGRWNVAQENFFKNNVNFLDAFALKLSYGWQGNVNDEQNPFMILRQGDFDATSQQFSNTLVRFPNPLLIWEKTKSYNLGVEFGLFDGLVSGGFEYYYKKGEDQIVSKNVTPTNGGSSFTLNEGNIENRGWDLSLSITPISRDDMSLSLSFNTGMNKNTVTNSGNPNMTDWNEYLDGTLIRDGYAVNSFYSYRFGGLDAYGLPTFKGTEFFAEDYDGEIKDLASAIQSAMVYSGKREPVTSGGFSLNYRYKRISLSSSFAYALGNKVRLYDLYDNANQTLPLPVQNMADEFTERWQKPGDEKHTDIPVLSDLPLWANKGVFRVADNYWQMYNKSDLRVVSGNYLKCTSFSISYQLPEHFVKKMKMQSCSCNFGCNNLFTWASRELDGQNPEAFGGTRTIPPQRTYSLSLNVSF